jgi:TetR/AcrR family transcriptional repressor of nem operon
MLITKTRRDPDRTRENLVQAAYWEIYRHGFRSASLEQILAKAGVTKGALYHHFPSKTALGHAVVEEIIRPLILRIWIEPMDRAESPLEVLSAIQQAMGGNLSVGACELGCPLNNLAQEMSPLDEGFRKDLNEIFQLWKKALTKALRQGQKQDQIRSDANPDRSAAFIIATIEGSIGMAKLSQDSEPWNACKEGLGHYIESLLEV